MGKGMKKEENDVSPTDPLCLSVEITVRIVYGRRCHPIIAGRRRTIIATLFISPEVEVEQGKGKRWTKEFGETSVM